MSRDSVWAETRGADIAGACGRCGVRRLLSCLLSWGQILN
jgi:hypothetical protein